MQKRDCSGMTQGTWQNPKVGLQILQILIRSSICANKSIVKTPWIRLSSVRTQDLWVCSVTSKGHLQQIILVQLVHCEVSGGICCTTYNPQDSKDSLPTSWCQGPHDSPRAGPPQVEAKPDPKLGLNGWYFARSSMDAQSDWILGIWWPGGHLIPEQFMCPGGEDTTITECCCFGGVYLVCNSVWVCGVKKHPCECQDQRLLSRTFDCKEMINVH